MVEILADSKRRFKAETGHGPREHQQITGLAILWPIKSLAQYAGPFELAPELSDMDLSPLPTTHQAKIPESYRDIMGHMNVMWYTHLFDTAVYGAFDLIGLTPEFMKQHNGGGFALEVHIRYLAEVHVDEEVTIQTRFLGRSKKRFHLLNFMWNQSTNRLAATFEVVGAYIDMTKRRMAEMPDVVTSQLDDMIRQHATLDWEAPVCGTMQP